MKEYSLVTTQTHKLESITCDVCKKIYLKKDIDEIQEFTYINKECGYGSVFGDENTVECDICQHCLKSLLKNKYRIIE